MYEGQEATKMNFDYAVKAAVKNPAKKDNFFMARLNGEGPELMQTLAIILWLNRAVSYTYPCFARSLPCFR